MKWFEKLSLHIVIAFFVACPNMGAFAMNNKAQVRMKFHDVIVEGIRETARAMLLENPQLAKETYHAGVAANEPVFLEVAKANNANIDENHADDGETPLARAAGLGHQRILEFLLVFKANIEATDAKLSYFGDIISDGKTALHTAAALGQTACVRRLIEVRANIHRVTTGNYYNSLMFAAEGGHAKTVKCLLVAKARIAQQSIEGDTALALAAQCGYVDVVRLLLQNGADPTLTNNNRLKPLELAARNSRADVVRLLLFNELSDEFLQNAAAFSFAICPEFPKPFNIEDALYGFMKGYRSVIDAGWRDTVTCFLKDKRTNINWQNKNGDTILHSMARQLKPASEDPWVHYQYAMLRTLIDAGGDITLKNNNGITPAQAAHFYELASMFEENNFSKSQDSDLSNTGEDDESETKEPILELNEEGQSFFAWAAKGFSDEYPAYMMEFVTCKLYDSNTSMDACECYPERQRYMPEVAVKTGNAKLLKALLDNPKVTNANWYCAEQLASVARNIEDQAIHDVLLACETKATGRDEVYEPNIWDSDYEANLSELNED